MSYKMQILKVNILMAVNVVHNMSARRSKFIGSL